MNLTFLLKISWKSFRQHPGRVSLMSLFLGIAVGLFWLSWDTQQAIEEFLNTLWSKTGIPYHVRSLTGETQNITEEGYGPISIEEWQKIIEQDPPQGPWIPWRQGELQSRGGKTFTWVSTDPEYLPEIRPWVHLEPPGKPLYLGSWQRLNPEDFRLLCQNKNPCDPDLAGNWTTGHERLDVLLDIHSFPAGNSVDWFEGRWTGQRDAFDAWRKRIEAQYGLVVIADQPSLQRFRITADMLRGYLQWTGLGILLISVLTFGLILWLDAYHRRYEWAIWMSLGAKTLTFLTNFLSLSVFWGIGVFFAANGVYWLGRGYIYQWLPELYIRPSIWEGPAVAILGGFLCVGVSLPTLMYILRIQPASFLRSE